MAEAGGRPKRSRKAPIAFEATPLRRSRAAPPKHNAAAWNANGQKQLSGQQNSERQHEFARHAAVAASAAPPAPAPPYKQKRPRGRGSGKRKRPHKISAAAAALEIPEDQQGGLLRAGKGLTIGPAAGSKRKGEVAAAVLHLATGAAAAASSDPVVESQLLLTTGLRLVRQHSDAPSSELDQLDHRAIVVGLLSVEDRLFTHFQVHLVALCACVTFKTRRRRYDRRISLPAFCRSKLS